MALDLDAEQYRLPALQVKHGGKVYDFNPTPDQVARVLDIFAEHDNVIKGEAVTEVLAIFTGEDKAKPEDQYWARLNFLAQRAVLREIADWLNSAFSGIKKKEGQQSPGSADSTD